MFRAIGIGYAHSLPSAAALNWVLKDGLGRLSRCIYTACLASVFDTNLKVYLEHLLVIYVSMPSAGSALCQRLAIEEIVGMLGLDLNKFAPSCLRSSHPNTPERHQCSQKQEGSASWITQEIMESRSKTNDSTHYSLARGKNLLSAS
ncbi:hypothetical protein DCAR_0933952 [Daucus carota subsp. sativus]|uniref:Protein root UVB sensitive/RUS domain-containing protein n=1 Tax=Daucus carota subsp. sativus TaxID=79200 RepID=A0A175YDZ0_DAUCS|nr:hypothetical protein DCAR_0933952 [Daucus carota subsp. sativus]